MGSQTKTPARRITSSYRWVILVLSWLHYFSFGLIYTTLSTLVNPVMNSLNLSYSQMGVILGSWQLVYIFFAQPAGIIIDRIGPYKSLLFGATIISLSAILRWFAASFESLFFFVALFGIGGPMISIGLPKLTAMWFQGKERGTASGLYTTGNAVGGMVALSITNSIVMPLVEDWKKVFVIYSVIGLTITVLWFFFGQRSPETGVKTGVKRRESTWKIMKVLFKRRNIWIIVVIGITYFLAGHGLSNWLPTILALRGASPNEAGFMVSSLKIFGIIGSLLIPRLQYLVKSKKIAIALTLSVLGLAIFVLGFTGGVVLWIAMALTWITMRGLLPLLSVTLMDMPEVGPKRMGIIGGLYFSVGEIGGFGGPFLMGFMKDVTGSFVPGILLFALVSEMSVFLVTLLEI